ncbi:F-box domain-containing protein [Mycena venus]|uniref:F-box domain-containing protein n=1 Tax=Mycena venus TaxID=2733690 RepID=A0A8H6Y669_9AGAR|nr:F-box domain-containing protein [Mycena venus]
MSNAGTLRMQVFDLASAIARQEQLLDDMRTRLRELQSQLDSVIYPVLTLPPEITSEIFVYCLPAKRVWDVVNMEEAPLLLTHICRAWRQIAIATPQLWTSLLIYRANSLLQLDEIVKTWFQRARKCPLSVSIHGCLVEIGAFHDFMKTFQQHSQGMRSLELQTGVGDFWAMDSHFLELPLLQKLSIRFLAQEEDLDDENDPVTMFNNVPMLHEVLMGEIPPSFIALPWQQLTKFTGELYSVEYCLEALVLMPTIIECAFSVFGPENGGADGLEVVSHPNLRHLTLFESMSDLGARATSPYILTLLTLPALQTLEIQGVEDFDEVELNSFLLRSSPPLQKLAVRPLNLPGGTELQIDTPFTTLGLTELEIWYPYDDFIDLFFDYFGQVPSFLPQLQKLSFPGCRFEDREADVGDILRVAAGPITKRRAILAGCAQLQSFHVVRETPRGAYLCMIYPENLLLPFRKLKASGMDVYIQVGTEKRSAV